MYIRNEWSPLVSKRCLLAEYGFVIDQKFREAIQRWERGLWHGEFQQMYRAMDLEYWLRQKENIYPYAAGSDSASSAPVRSSLAIGVSF